jgi:hypothetical protein
MRKYSGNQRDQVDKLVVTILYLVRENQHHVPKRHVVRSAR